MIMAEGPRTRQDIQQEIVLKALKDEAYRQRLKADPKAALEETIGQSLPADVKVTAVEESTSNLYLVLPPPLPASIELSDDQLDTAAGGSGITVTLNDGGGFSIIT
jgi:Nitrile hydratase, alpha chain